MADFVCQLSRDSLCETATSARIECMAAKSGIRTLIVGLGALGGTIATRVVSDGMPVWLATRTAESARALRLSGLRVSGVGGAATAGSFHVAAMEEYWDSDRFDLILLATKAHEALKIAPFLSNLLTPDGTLLPIQNGSVSEILADRLRNDSFSAGCRISAQQ